MKRDERKKRLQNQKKKLVSFFSLFLLFYFLLFSRFYFFFDSARLSCSMDVRDRQARKRRSKAFGGQRQGIEKKSSHLVSFFFLQRVAFFNIYLSLIPFFFFSFFLLFSLSPFSFFLFFSCPLRISFFYPRFILILK